jgi:cation diffusion facilitator family transporter
MHPKALEMVGLGLVISSLASLVNFAVAMTLLKVGKKHKSITLKADGHHLLTDVWTSVGVVVGLILATVTGLTILDPIVALLVALNIIITGYMILKESALGLMDTALPDDELNKIKSILSLYEKKGVTYHGIKSRRSATRNFMSVHILVPGDWSVQKGHDLLEEIEKHISREFPRLSVFTHLEPVEDPKSLDDISIDRN